MMKRVIQLHASFLTNCLLQFCAAEAGGKRDSEAHRLININQNISK